MTEKQIGGNGMAKRQPTVLRVPENGAGDPFFGRQGNWFEVIFESSYDGFYITDGNAITLTLNKSYETISGLRKEEMVGRSMAELVTSRVISGSGTLLALERRESVTMEQQFKTGKRAIITSTPVFDSESNIVMVVTNVRDVTELYSLKEQLEQSEERNRLYSAELEAARSRQDRNPSSLIFHDKSMQNVISLLNRAAQMEVPVLLQGEVGVGKGALSEYIHSKSKRRKEHFITIPCASLPDDTMVAELFGLGPGVSPEYPQGKVGLLEQANRGVVFLDEVEQLNHECQTRLLSVIKRRQVKPLGYGADKPCDLRIIASTSADLLALVRERFAPETIICMQSYNWPGNIRELHNVVERMMIISKNNVIQPEELPITDNITISQKESEEYFEQVNLHKLVEQLEISYIRRAYSRYGNVRDAARSLGMDASTFVRKRKKIEQGRE